MINLYGQVGGMLITSIISRHGQVTYQWGKLMTQGIAYNNKKNRDLHYVFVESQSTHRDEDPIILWLNGGPGCSSLLGLMQEIGPFVIDNGETEYKANPWSWNLQAHLLILESPSGVGFSRSPKDAKF